MASPEFCKFRFLFFNNSVNEVTMLWPERSDLAKSGDRFNLAMVLCTQIIQALVCTKKVVTKHVILDESLRLYGQAFKRAWWMPWQPEAMKDVVGYDKPRGAAKQALIRGCPNGETHPTCRVSCTEYIGTRSERGELKHLSTRRKRNQLRFPE